MTETKTLVYYTNDFSEKHLMKKLQLTKEKILIKYQLMALVELTNEQNQELEKDGIITEKLTHGSLELKSVGPLSRSQLIQPQEIKSIENKSENRIVWMIEFVGPIKVAWLKYLTKKGVVIGDALPPYGIFAYMKPSLAVSLQEKFIVSNESPIEWIGRYTSELKREKQSFKKLQKSVNDQLVIHYFPWSSQLKKSKKIDLDTLTRRVSLGHRNIDELVKSEGVQYVELKLIPKLLNAEAKAILQTSVAHDNLILGQNQILAVTDTGIYKAHETMINPGKIVAVVDFAGDSNQLGGDADGHGTHVACSTAGDSQPYNQWNKEDGQSTAGRLVDVKVFNNSGNWAVTTSDYTIWSRGYETGARVNNNSWGSESFGQYTSTDRDADRICSEKPDYVLVVAAGNSGSAARTVGSPGVAKNVLSVGASGSSQTTAENVATFSSRGPTTDGRIKPDILAPGNPIISAQTQTVSGYVSYNGTSMACPQITGLAGLVRQYFQDGWYPTGARVSINSLQPSSALIRAMLINGAQEITGTGSDLQSENRFPNNSQGWGRANLKRTLPIATDPTRRLLTIWDVKTAPLTGARWNTSISITNNPSEIKFTLVWTDPPAAAGASVSLVTNLHLRIQAPNGQYFLGNNFTGRNPGYSISGGSFDNRNTIEGIHFVANHSFGTNTLIPNGTYQIEVISANTNIINNGFALVMGLTQGSSTIPTPPTPPKIAIMGDFNSQLTTLLKSQGYVVDNYISSNYTELINNINNYQSIILNRVTDSIGFNNLIQATPPSTGLVFLGTYPIENSGLGLLSIKTGDPAGINQKWGLGAVKVKVTSQHPIFNGAQLGEEMIIINGGDNDYQTYQSLINGLNLGQNIMPSGATWMIGIRPETATKPRHVLLGSLGASSYTNTAHWTTKGKLLFLNSVAWSAKLETKHGEITVNPI